ncbi:MAG: aconitase X catalytic domain-containing protein [Hyphomicrobiales bacterium]|nr:aconitase X catalytic domain-containing protein [Hyphomicrobiales bacterium]
MELTAAERQVLNDSARPALALAMGIVVEAGRMLGAARLLSVASAHIDGCLYHGDSGVHFLERLVAGGGRVAVPATLNVGALDLLHPDLVGGEEHRRAMARRLMDAHVALGCTPTWTCAPYQAGHRPALGQHVAWGESNAVAFANSVLGARTERYGDFLDISCALTGRAPAHGLHLDANRRATVRVDVTGLSPALLRLDAFYPVLGAWLGAAVGGAVAVIDGLPADVGEDALKALGAGAAATGAVGLFHVAGVTPEAPTVAAAGGGAAPRETITLTAEMVRAARDRLSTASAGELDCIALGSPHFSAAETRTFAGLLAGRRPALPVYLCTGRHAVDELDRDGLRADLEALGVTFVVDTCVVVTPILKGGGGAMMTNSAKFAHYGQGNTGKGTLFGTLSDCVESAVAGRLARDESQWR